MFSRKAREIPWKRKSLLFSALVIAVLGITTVAFASSQPPWTVIFGTPNNDTINESSSTLNYRIYGFQGKNTITGSKGAGQNILIGNGQCPPGVGDGSTIQVIPPPANDPENNADQYCNYNWDTGQPGDVLTGGGGITAFFGGGGNNTIVGSKTNSNFVEDGPSTDTITGGNAGDIIDATNGPSTIHTGTGTNAVDVVGSFVSSVYCGGDDYVYATHSDHLYNCAHVYYESNTTRHSLSSKFSYENFSKHAKKAKDSKRSKHSKKSSHTF
jgi:hypothetical protein